MTTMVERVARAICAASAQVSYITVWDEQNPEVRKFWLEVARAAIGAMREPTEAMVEKATQNSDDGVISRVIGRVCARLVYESMIDAALAEKP